MTISRLTARSFAFLVAVTQGLKQWVRDFTAIYQDRWRCERSSGRARLVSIEGRPVPCISRARLVRYNLRGWIDGQHQ